MMEINKPNNNKMVVFAKSTLLADVILTDYRLIPIIGRFNIDYGFGNKTVGEVCKVYDINVNFFLEIINFYHQPNYFPANELQNYTSKLVVKYLMNTHKYYREVKLPKIQAYIDQMLQELSEVSQFNVKLLCDFFMNYKNELEKHLLKEEKYVFPYALALEEASITGEYDKKLFDKITEVPIDQYEHNHNEMEVTLSDLKNLIIRHLSPVFCNQLCQNLLLELFELEKDLDMHSLMEEKVLIPRVEILEQNILSGRE